MVENDISLRKLNLFSAKVEQIPRTALVYHEHPYPPPNIKLSRSYQYDIESNNPRLSKPYFYLFETFYIEAVVSRFSCKIILQLPCSLQPTLPKDASASEREFNDQGTRSTISPNPLIRENIQTVLKEFRDFNENHKKEWSALQLHTLELFCSFFTICLCFLRDSIINSDSSIHPFSLHKRHLADKLDLTNVENVLHVHETVPEAMSLIEKTFVYLSEPENYYEQSEFLPHGIIISAMDAASQVLMYSYQLEQTERVRYYLEKTVLILSIPAIWADWGTAKLVKVVIADFLKANPSVTMSPNSSLFDNDNVVTINSIISVGNGMTINDNNNSAFAAQFNASSIDLLNSSLLQEQQIATHPVMNDFFNNPWLTGEEPWIQDINNIIYSSSVSSMSCKHSI